MKSLIKNTDAVAYLLLVGLGLSIVVSAICFNFISDFVDIVLYTTGRTYANMPLAQMDADSIQTGNLLFMCFKFCLIPVMFVLIYFCFVMAQKPVKSW